MGKMVAQWHTQCNPRLLHRCVGICFVYSSAGEGSARVPGRDEFWYEEELRQKALAGSTATTRVRFFWGTDIHASLRCMVFIRVKVRRMKRPRGEHAVERADAAL